MMESLSSRAGQAAGLGLPSSDQGMSLSDPTAVRALLEPDVPMDQIPGSVAWITMLMTLFYWNVPLSVLGRWLGVHKTTILRWIVGLALALWPTIYGWILDRVNAKMVYIDEKWIKIRGRWRYWYVVLDVQTELPVLAALLPSRTKWACRWLGCLLKRIKKIPGVIITDGLHAYASLWPGIKHVLCRFHHQQGVTQWLNKHFATDAEIARRKPAMKKLFQTTDKRTVRRRLAHLKNQAPALGIVPWVSTVMDKLPSLICSIGSRRLPSTTNAIERFFRTFNRFYKTRGGFHSLLSAKRELILFLVVYLFTQRSTDGKAPIERIVPQASLMPLYRLINDPLRTLREFGYVKKKTNMADFLLAHVAAA
jgi:transposase-like protein